MSEDLKKQLVDLLSHLLTSIEKGAAFVSDQVPPLVKEKITLGRIEETTLFIIFMVALVPIFLMWRWVNKRQWNSYSEAKVFSYIGLVIGTVACTVIIFNELHNTLLVWFAPRLYIIEWLREMVK